MTGSADAIALVLRPNDVIQLDPAHCEWGPMFVIVTDIHAWGVQGYWLVAEKRGEPPGRAYVRVQHGYYELVGHATWAVAT